MSMFAIVWNRHRPDFGTYHSMRN